MRKIIICFLLVGFSLSETQAREGEFRVLARNPISFPFTNPSSQPMTIQFTASGLWQWKRGQNSSSSGAPYICRLFGTCPKNDANVGALLVRQGPTFLLIEDSIELRLRANETVYFIMNDARNFFYDNSGAIDVGWTCLDGCETI